MLVEQIVNTLLSKTSKLCCLHNWWMMPEWHQYLSLHKLLKCHNYTLFQKACHYTRKLNCWCRVWKAFLWWYISTFWHDWRFLMKQHKKFDNLFNCKIHARFKEIFVNIIHSQLARVKGRWKVLKQCMKGPSRWKMKITWPSCQEKPKNHPSTRFKLFFWKRNDVLQIWITMWV